MTTYKPESYPDAAPYLLVADVESSLAFLEAALGAAILRTTQRDGAVVHGEARVGDTVVMLGRAPGQPGAHVHLYLSDPDAAIARAIAADASLVQSMEERGDGDRRGGVKAPDGTTWWLARRVPTR
ncbi:hypothetical protein ACHAXT_009151 [Thalassiosira profunda]